MHLSIYDEWTEAHSKAKIYMDGREVDKCVEASEEGGFVVRYTGETIYDHLNSPSLATERLEGKVEIVIEE